jgi:hypothetical protein
MVKIWHFCSKEYTGKLIFEELYEWMNEKKKSIKKDKKEKSKCKSCGGSKAAKRQKKVREKS